MSTDISRESILNEYVEKLHAIESLKSLTEDKKRTARVCVYIDYCMFVAAYDSERNKL